MSSYLAENRITQKSDGKYDIFKFVLSIFIVAIHSELFPLVLYPWLRIAVPLFFVISSYFLFGKLNRCSEKQEKNSIVKNFVKRNLQLYAFWLFLFIPRLYNRREMFTENFLKGILSIVKTFFFGSTFGASWFIMASVIAVLLVFALSKRLNNKMLLIISLVIYFFVVVDSSYKFAFDKGSIVYYIVTWYSRIFGSPVCSFSVAMVWVTCGKCFAERTFNFSRKTYIVISVLFAVVLYGEWLFVKSRTGNINNDCYFSLVPLCIGLFGWIKSLPPIVFEKSIYLRHCSTFIYPLHITMIAVVNFLYKNLFGIVYNTTLNFVTTVILCILGYFVVEWLLNKYPKNKIVQILRYSY